MRDVYVTCQDPEVGRSTDCPIYRKTKKKLPNPKKGPEAVRGG